MPPRERANWTFQDKVLLPHYAQQKEETVRINTSQISLKEPEDNNYNPFQWTFCITFQAFPEPILTNGILKRKEAKKVAKVVIILFNNM